MMGVGGPSVYECKVSGVESKPATKARIKTGHFFLFKLMEGALARSDR
jgi:hypothetical protein